MPARRKRREELVDQRRSRVENVTAGVLERLGEVPPPGRSWPVCVKRLYESVFSSGQAAFLQDSDVAYAWFVCSELAGVLDDDSRARASELAREEWASLPEEDREGLTEPPFVRRGSSTRFETLMSALNSLMFTEVERRKARLELRPPVSEDSVQVVALDYYRKKLDADVAGA